MFKLVWKTIFITFGWFIILVNIVLFFNMTSSFVFFGQGMWGDTSDKYFGVSTLINAFKGLDHTPIGKFATGFKSFVDNVFKFARSFYGADWPSWSDNRNFIDFITDIFNVVKNIFGYIFSIYIMLFGSFLMFTYTILLFLNILYTMFALLSGMYISEVPQSTILDSVSHCMTPLLQCYPLWVGV